MKNQVLCLLSVIVVAVFSGCVSRPTYVYVPNNHPTFAHGATGNQQLSATNTNVPVNGTSPQVVYAPLAQPAVVYVQPAPTYSYVTPYYYPSYYSGYNSYYRYSSYPYGYRGVGFYYSGSYRIGGYGYGGDRGGHQYRPPVQYHQGRGHHQWRPVYSGSGGHHQRPPQGRSR